MNISFGSVLEGLGEGFGTLLGRIFEAQGDFWEVKSVKKGEKNEARKKNLKRPQTQHSEAPLKFAGSWAHGPGRRLFSRVSSPPGEIFSGCI